MRAKRPVIFTIGHSTRTFPEFAELLAAYGVATLVDVRSVPRSRHTPQFNAAPLARSLEKRGIRYAHLAGLGGLRHAKKGSGNAGWRNASFRGYADHMATPEFARGLETLVAIARERTTAIMCAEAVPWRCHRSLIADALIKKGWLVRDIMSRTSAPPRAPTPFLRVKNGVLTYPAPASARLTSVSGGAGRRRGRIR